MLWSLLRYRSAAALAAALVVLCGTAASAGAHPMATSAVLLDIRHDAVTGEVQLPLDRLALALRRDITPAQAAGSQRASLEAYTAKHIAATATDGAAWDVKLGRSSVRTIDGTPHVVLPLRLTPPQGRDVADFKLRYDVIVEQLVTHKAIATVRTEQIGVFDWTTHELTVPADGGSWLAGVVSSSGLGVQHVSTGADHLLFLLMLLLPAPLVATAGRWRRGPSGRRGAVRVVHVVSAFAVGHTMTLLLAGFGVVHVPSRPVETLIALSIAVSALHAIRPLIARGEVLIAAGFGLVHGLAFASAINELGLDRGSLVSSLFGFNIGIEVTQLLVVALTMPSLVVLAGTAWYATFRLGVAAIGLAFAVSWTLERATLTSTDPFLPVTDWLVANPLVVTASIAVLAAGARAVTRSPARVMINPCSTGAPIASRSD